MEMEETIRLKEIIRLMRETEEYLLVEKVVQEGGNLNEVKRELRNILIKEPMKKSETLCDLSVIRNALDTLGEKLDRKETDEAIKWYLEKTEYIGEGKKKYYWQEYIDQLLILAEIGSFSQETADKLLLKPFNRHFSNEEFSTTGQILELSRKLMPMASESVKKILRDWYFKGIVEKEVPGGYWDDRKNVEEVEVDRDTMTVEINRAYHKIVFKRSCVVSGSLTAVEIEAKDSLVIFGDLAVERRIEVKGNLTVTGKLRGGNYRSSYWHNSCYQEAVYTGHIVIGGSLIANTIKTYASLNVKGDIISENIAVPKKIQAKNILTSGTLRMYHEGWTTIKVEDKIVAYAVLTEAHKGEVKAKEVDVLIPSNIQRRS